MKKRTHGCRINQLQPQEFAGRETPGNNETHEEDERISQLPDSILHHILSCLPTTSLIRTSILSSRWKELWKHALSCSTTLDFGEDFTSVQRYSHVAISTINRYLQMHTRNYIESFRLFLRHSELYEDDIRKLIEFALGKRVKELDLDFPPTRNLLPFLYKLPASLFSCDSLTTLKLTGCKFVPPSGFKGFNSLKTLCLRNVHIADDVLERMLLNCLVLEELNLLGCSSLHSLPMSAVPLWIRSFALIGCCGLDDVTSFLFGLVGVRILTLCHLAVDNFNKVARAYNSVARQDMHITFSNLIELQLGVYDGPRLASLYKMFRHCSFPCLEKLFIMFHFSSLNTTWVFSPPPPLSPSLAAPSSSSSSSVFHSLKIIKMNGFYGSNSQMEMVRFLLEKAVVLKTIILVTPKKGTKECVGKDSTSEIEPGKASLRLLHEQLLLFPKASSYAELALYEQTEDDNSLCPTLVEIFNCV